MPLRVVSRLVLVVWMASGVMPVSAQLVNVNGGGSPPPGSSPRLRSQATPLPADLEGNWFVERHGYPKPGLIEKTVVVLRRDWELKCVKDGAACRYRNEMTNAKWTLEDTDYEHWGATDPEVTATGVKYRWGWGRPYETNLTRTGPDELRGRWSVYTGEAGTETWRRAVPDVDRVEFTVMSSDNPQRTIIWTKGQPPPRVEGTSDAFTSVQVKVMGTNLWGHQLMDAGGAVDLEPRKIWGTYLVGKRVQVAGRPPTYLQTHAYEGYGDVRTIIGLQKRFNLGPLFRQGMKVVRVGSIAIPFEVIVTGSNAAALDETGEKKTLRFVEKSFSGAFEPLRELAYNREFFIEAAFPPPHTAFTREATVTWEGNSAGRKVVLRLRPFSGSTRHSASSDGTIRCRRASRPTPGPQASSWSSSTRPKCGC